MLQRSIQDSWIFVHFEQTWLDFVTTLACKSSLYQEQISTFSCTFQNDFLRMRNELIKHTQTVHPQKRFCFQAIKVILFHHSWVQFGREFGRTHRLWAFCIYPTSQRSLTHLFIRSLAHLKKTNVFFGKCKNLQSTEMWFAKHAVKVKFFHKTRWKVSGLHEHFGNTRKSHRVFYA